MPPWPAFCTAWYRAVRNKVVSTKSLKCPACKDASWRLSVKLSIFRAAGSNSRSLRKFRISDRLRIVVSVLRPPELNSVNLVKSEDWRDPYVTPQCRQNRNGAGKNWTAKPWSVTWPIGLIWKVSGRYLRWPERTRNSLLCSSIQSSGSLSSISL